MIKLLLLFTATAVISADSKLLNIISDETLPRVEKSLVNTFPFNQNQKHAHHGDHHGDHHDHHEGPVNHLFRQYGAEEEEPSSDGKKCVKKVMMVWETEWNHTVTCDHSYDKRCHKSFVTTYQAQQEEECDEVFRKICYIEMVDVANNVTTQICKKPLVKDCPSEQGEPVCTTKYQSECWNKEVPHEVEDDVVECKTVEDEKCMNVTEGYTTKERCEKWPRQECSVSKQTTTKYTTMTGCHKEPILLCGPPECGWVEGPEQCHDEVRTVISERPEEECVIEPQRQCKHVTKLVPQLQEVEECVDVPKEICTRQRTNPKKVQRPVIKNWCYTPAQPEEEEEPASSPYR